MLRSDTSAVWKKTKDLSCILFGHWLCFLHPWWLDVVHCLGLQVLNTAANDWKPPLPYKDKHCFLMCSKGQRLQRRFRFHSGKKYSLQNYLIYGPRLKHQRFHQNRKTKLKNCVTISPLMRLLFFGIMKLLTLVLAFKSSYLVNPSRYSPTFKQGADPWNSINTWSVGMLFYVAQMHFINTTKILGQACNCHCFVARTGCHLVDDRIFSHG